MGKRVTARDVAELAGVSQAAVSMILNNRPDVSFSEDTVKRVLEAARTLDYSKLRSKFQDFPFKNVIAIITPALSNPYYADLCQAVEQAAKAAGFSTIICNSYRDKCWERQIVSTVLASGISGIMFASVPQDGNLALEANLRIPTVIIGDKSYSAQVDTIEINSYSSGTILADYLFEQGHRNVALCSTTLSPAHVIRYKRFEGLRDAFERCPEPVNFVVKSKTIVPKDEISTLNLEHHVGYTLTKEHIKDDSEKRITAFVAINDMVAYGILDALIEDGLSIPQDYSVCGFDNVFPSSLRTISLTTVEHFMQDKGHDAFDLLLHKIAESGKSDSTAARSITRIEYVPQLIVRGSTGPARDITR